MPLRTLLASLALLLLGVSPPARAETPVQAAKRHYIAASHHFDLQEYAQALAEFKEAYRLKDDPVFLFNIAQCHRLIGDKDEALRAYKTYLARSPQAPNRADVEARIASIERELEDARQAKAAEDERQRKAAEESAALERQLVAAAAVVVAAPAPQKKTPVYKKWWLWTAVGGGLVAVGLGVGLGIGLTQSKGEPLFRNVSF